MFGANWYRLFTNDRGRRSVPVLEESDGGLHDDRRKVQSMLRHRNGHRIHGGRRLSWGQHVGGAQQTTGFDLLGIDAIKALGGIAVGPSRQIQIGDGRVAKRTDITINEPDFTATFHDQSRAWTAAWKWSEERAPEGLNNGVSEYPGGVWAEASHVYEQWLSRAVSRRKTLASQRFDSPDSCKVKKLATIVEGNPKAPFSIATTPRCRGRALLLPWIALLYPWSVPYNAEC